MPKIVKVSAPATIANLGPGFGVFGEAYFGAFELPPDAAPGEREVELKGELLIISIPRRRRYLHTRPN